MGKSLAAPAPMLPGLIDEKHLDELTNSFSVSQEGYGGQIFINRLPSANERELLQRHNAAISESLKPHGVGSSNPPCDARRALAAMFHGYPSLRNADVMDLLDAYMLVLQKYPLGAILGAVEDIVNNRVEKLSLDYPPTSVRVGSLAAKHMGRVGAVQARIDKILVAKRLLRPVSDPAARERIGVGLRNLAGQISPGVIAGTLTDDDRARIAARHKLEARQQILDEWKHLGLSPIINNDGSPITVALAIQIGHLIEIRDRHGSRIVPKSDVARDGE